MKQVVDADVAVDVAVEVVRASARAEFVVWSTLLDETDRAIDAINASDVTPMVKQVELSFVAQELGQRICWSEGQVSHLVAKARRLRDKAPTVWAAFAAGLIDAARAREIASTIDRLEREESIARLDRQVIAYAERHTTAQLRRWLKLFVARVESDLFNERAQRGRDDRNVDVQHGDDGMSTLILTHTSLAIAAISKRLRKEATNPVDGDDTRTQAQRQADLLAAWATTTDNGAPAAHTDIAPLAPTIRRAKPDSRIAMRSGASRRALRRSAAG